MDGREDGEPKRIEVATGRSFLSLYIYFELKLHTCICLSLAVPFWLLRKRMICSLGLQVP